MGTSSVDRALLLLKRRIEEIISSQYRYRYRMLVKMMISPSIKGIMVMAAAQT
jgi:hypothetical protein